MKKIFLLFLLVIGGFALVPTLPVTYSIDSQGINAYLTHVSGTTWEIVAQAYAYGSLNGKTVPLHFRATVVGETLNYFGMVIRSWSASASGYGRVTFSSYNNFAGGESAWGRVISKQIDILGL